jgi:YD repeat-containing protein
MRRTTVVAAVLVVTTCLPTLSAQAETYTYDALGRLVVVSTDDAKRFSYSFDGLGNRLQSAGAAGALQGPKAGDDPFTYSYGSGPLVFDPRTNDYDPAGLAFTIVGISPPQFGSATFTPTSVTYTAPTTHIAQTDVFSYTIQNSAGLVSSAFVTVALTNAQPIANPDAVSTVQNQPVTFDPRQNDSDPGGNTLSITAVTTPSHGAASFTATSVTYTPATGFVGSDSFGYSIANGVGGTASSTISVTVSPSGAPLSAALSSNVWTWSQVSTGPIHRSDPIAVTAAGGYPPYSYAWEYVSGDTGITVAPLGDGSSAVWNRTISGYGSWTATWRVRVTDSNTNTTTSSDITVRFLKDSGG